MPDSSRGPDSSKGPDSSRGGEAAVPGEERWARKNEVSLFLWRKRLPDAEVAGRPPVVLVHGSSLAGQPSFDLTVPGHADYSMMDWLAHRGWDVWTLDHEGYGRSSVTEGNSDIACGVEDLRAALPVIAEASGAEACHLYGMSSGALRAAAFAQAEPGRVARLALDRGEHDGIASLDDLLGFFARLPGGDKRFAVLPGLAHCTPLGLARHLMWRTLEDFFRAGDPGA